MSIVGRFLQVLGLIILPASLVIEATGGLGRDFGVSHMLVMMIFGAALFGLGRLIGGYAR